MPRSLELRRNNVGYVRKTGDKRDQRGRDVQVLKAAGHGILAANGRDPKVNLCHESAKQRRRRLTPTSGIVTKLLKVFLEGKVEPCVVKARCHQARNGLNNGKIRSAELVGFHEVRVEAPRHTRDRGCLAKNRQLCHHGKRRSQLTSAAKGHKHGSCADGRVKAFGKPLVGGNVEVLHQRVELFSQRRSCPGVSVTRVSLRLFQSYGRGLRSAV